jgi:hypothetical protein
MKTFLTVSIIQLLCQQFPQTPHVIRDPGCHRRRNPKTFVDAARVIEREPERDGSPMFLPFLVEGVR